MNTLKGRPFFYLLSLSLAVTTMLCAASSASYGAALLNVQGKGMAPNQTVILSTGPKQKLQARTAQDGSVNFTNLKYSPETNLSFSLSYQVSGSGSKIIPNNILIDVDPFIGTVRLRGSATRAASVILNMSGEDSYAMVANQSGYFAGSADSLSGFSDGRLNVVASIINVEENCCPRTIKPYLPVSISITGQPEKKAGISLIRTNEMASYEISLPDTSYGVSVPDKLIKESWITGVHNLSNNLIESVQRQTNTLGTFMQSQLNTSALRKLQEQEVGIAKNYLPSEQVCRYATLNQGLAASEMAGKANKTAMMSSLLANEMKSTNSVVSGKNPDQDKDV
ncbi:MAG: hypothetical protein DI586_00595, partial [Micavibrio aeruginosavorus]